jgi:site-specific DNA recombinase
VSAAVRDVLVRGCNAGILESGGVEVGRLAGEPIVDREVFDRVRALVLGRRRGRAYGDRYVGTGFLRCGRCEALLSAHPNGTLANGEPRRVYFCNTQRRGCVGSQPAVYRPGQARPIRPRSRPPRTSTGPQRLDPLDTT